MKGAPRDLFPAHLREAAATIFGDHAGAAIVLRQPDGALDEDFLADNPAIAALLHPGEIARFNEYRYAKRRAEYLTGRVCAKMALQLLWGRLGVGRMPEPAAVEIVNGPSGRPRPDLAGWTPEALPHISISHGGDYGAAIAGATPCGIDIQEHKEALLRVRDRYCTAGELQLLRESLPDREPLAVLALLWAAKEAAKKTLACWQMPGFLDLELASPVSTEAGCHRITLAVKTAAKGLPMPGTATVLATGFGDYSLAICFSALRAPSSTNNRGRSCD